MSNSTELCHPEQAASGSNLMDVDLDELEYRGVEVSLSPCDCQIMLTCNRTRFILVLERPNTPENGDVLEEWFRKIEEAEADPDETMQEQVVEDFQQSAISACKSLIFSLSAPAATTKQEAQLLEDVLHPTTFCVQLFSKQGCLLPSIIDNSKMYLDKYEPVALHQDSLPSSTSFLIPTSDLIFIEDLYAGLVSKVTYKDGKIYVFKRADLGNEDQVLREIQVLQQISQRWELDQPTRPPVPYFVGLVESHNDIVGFLEEFIDGVKLSELDLEQVSTIQRRSWRQCIAQALTLLHGQDFVWGDVKADNVLIDKDKRPWLIDFGGSTTDGWVEQHLAETKEGDLQGMRHLVQYLDLRN